MITIKNAIEKPRSVKVIHWPSEMTARRFYDEVENSSCDVSGRFFIAATNRIEMYIEEFSTNTRNMYPGDYLIVYDDHTLDVLSENEFNKHFKYVVE